MMGVLQPVVTLRGVVPAQWMLDQVQYDEIGGPDAGVLLIGELGRGSGILLFRFGC